MQYHVAVRNVTIYIELKNCFENELKFELWKRKLLFLVPGYSSVKVYVRCLLLALEIHMGTAASADRLSQQLICTLKEIHEN